MCIYIYIYMCVYIYIYIYSFELIVNDGLEELTLHSQYLASGPQGPELNPWGLKSVPSTKLRC